MQTKWHSSGLVRAFLMQDLSGVFLVLAAAAPVQLWTANASVAHPLDVLYKGPFSDLCAHGLPWPNPGFISGGQLLKGKLLQRGTSPSSPSYGREWPEPRQSGFSTLGLDHELLPFLVHSWRILG